MIVRSKKLIKIFKNSTKKQEELFKCDGEVFGKKIDLRKHIICTHPKNITCDICDKISPYQDMASQKSRGVFLPEKKTSGSAQES